jgi:putative hydrolase of the HAD superfamily
MSTASQTGSPISVLFTDVGGVLATNGWDHLARQRVAEHFGIDYKAMNERHAPIFDIYEEGKLTLDEYMARVVFNERRSFSPADFRRMMFAQSVADPQMMGLARALKARHGLRVVVVSNEGRELSLHRFDLFGMREFVDFFVVSCFVGMRKPDPAMYRMAIDMSQVPPEQIAYLDDRPMLAEAAAALGIRAIRHTDIQSTRSALAALGLPVD